MNSALRPFQIGPEQYSGNTEYGEHIKMPEEPGGFESMSGSRMSHEERQTQAKRFMERFPFLLLIIACAVLLPPSGWSQTNEETCGITIQQITDEALLDAMKSLDPKGMVITVAEPKAGRILAISGCMKETIPELQNHKGWVCWEMFEPESTFKPVVAVAALETGVITPKTKINCEHGVVCHQGELIRDSSPLGEATVGEILSKSSSIGAFKLSTLLKDEDFYNFILKFGFGERTGIPFPDEIKGLVNPPSKWLELSKAHMSFGRSVAVSSIQLTMAYCAIANGGLLMRPTLGNEKPKVVRRVCSEQTANLVKSALRSAVFSDGTAPVAGVDGMTAGGMAGRVQAINLKDGSYLPNQYWNMLAGFFPADDPRYVVVVAVDRANLPPEKNTSRLVAAPIFRKVASKISAIGSPSP